MSVPYSMHAVGKVRENMKKDGGCGAGNTSSTTKQESGWQSQRQDSLQSYSSKMMKSIWGEYNRYSVHNFKSNQSSGLPSAGAGQGGASVSRTQGGQGRGLFQ